MKTYLLCFGICLTICTVPHLVTGEKSCKEFITETSGKVMASFFECKKEATYKSDDDRIQKIPCAIVCAMKKQNMLSPEGYVDESSLLTFVEEKIPKAVQGRAMELMLPCQEHAGSLNPEEEFCLSYKGLLKCALSVVFKVCN